MNMKKALYLSLALAALVFFPNHFANAQGGVGINSAGSPPDNSALLDVSGINKGVLIPRLSTAQRDAIPSPANGLTIFNTDCNVYNFNAGTSSSPSWATINSSNALVAGVTISSNPVGAICTGASVTFTATPANGINSPGYQWKVNGSNVGTNSTTFTSTGLSNGDVVTCVLTSTAPCIIGSPATSNAIVMLVNTVPSITGTTPTGFCGGSAVTLNASADLGTINWYANATGGSPLSSGSSFTVSGLSSTTTYYVDATANGCTTASRTAITATYYPNAPAQPGAVAGATTVNKNDTSTYSISAVPNTATYSWLVTGGTISSGQGSASILVTWGDSAGYGAVSVASTNACATSAAQTESINIQVQTFYYTGANQTFTAPAGVTSVQYLVVAGGGGGAEGGGGGGGFVTGTLPVVPGNTYTVTVGNGGAPGNANGNAANGQNSVFASVTAIGGGGGGAQNNNGLAGGSGGGGGAEGGGSSGGAGTGGQGYNGGNGQPTPNPNYAAGGGGGAGGAGGAATGSPYTNGAGGPGLSSSLSGANVYYAGGGGGSDCCGGGCCNINGPGGIGGGGAGSNSGVGSNGTANTGGGGGGGFGDSNSSGGHGGSGIVIIGW